MNQKPMNYNLLVEQWIPILMTDGRYARVPTRVGVNRTRRNSKTSIPAQSTLRSASFSIQSTSQTRGISECGE
jgi:hypothetical protein